MIMRTLLLAVVCVMAALGVVPDARADTIRVPGDQGNTYNAVSYTHLTLPTTF